MRAFLKLYQMGKNIIKLNAAYHEYGKGIYYNSVEGIKYDIPELPGLSFAYHKEEKENGIYVIREVISGQVVARAKTLKGLKESIEENYKKHGIDRCREMIIYCINEFQKQTTSPKE
jgi:hypothetical protein